MAPMISWSLLPWLSSQLFTPGVLSSVYIPLPSKIQLCFVIRGTPHSQGLLGGAQTSQRTTPEGRWGDVGEAKILWLEKVPTKEPFDTDLPPLFLSPCSILVLYMAEGGVSSKPFLMVHFTVSYLSLYLVLWLSSLKSARYRYGILT